MDNFRNFHQSMQIASEQFRKSLTPLCAAVQEARRLSIMPIELPKSTQLAIGNVQGLVFGLGKLAEDAARLNSSPMQIVKNWSLDMEQLRIDSKHLRIASIDWSLLGSKIERPRVRKPSKKK